VTGTNRLEVEGLSVGYSTAPVISELDVVIPDGSFTVIVGPNACGKSTLLRSLARLLKPTAGHVFLDGAVISSYPAKEVARRIGLLPQTSTAPDGITVLDLVSRGRYPHQSLLRQWSEADETAVNTALAATNTAELATRFVDELSGGQRQRVWVAMSLAQQTPLLLLDEPTTFLDIAHQVELLDLFADLNVAGERTLVAVLHDLNQASRYATHLIAMKDGRIVAQGAPSDIVTADMVLDVFGLRCRIITDPESGTPLVIPLARAVTGRNAQPEAQSAAQPTAPPVAQSAAQPAAPPVADPAVTSR
jgi:ABC-type cobalamin/Fe3+-siderophores transport system ATPase subunit